VVADPQARYFGAVLDDLGLKPRNPATLPRRFQPVQHGGPTREPRVPLGRILPDEGKHEKIAHGSRRAGEPVLVVLLCPPTVAGTKR
jgi:hypothetical protein